MDGNTDHAERSNAITRDPFVQTAPHTANSASLSLLVSRPRKPAGYGMSGRRASGVRKSRSLVSGLRGVPTGTLRSAMMKPHRHSRLSRQRMVKNSLALAKMATMQAALKVLPWRLSHRQIRV